MDLWGSVGSCGEPTVVQRAVEIVGVSLASHEIKRNAGACDVPASDFRIASLFGGPMFSYGFSLESNGLK